MVARFHDEHRKTYGHGSNADPADIVSIRIYARVESDGATFEYEKLSLRAGNGRAAQSATRRAYFGRDAGTIDTPVISRDALDESWRMGPFIVEEYDATCVVPPGTRARLDALGNIDIELPIEAER